MNDTVDTDPRLYAIPDVHGHAKGEHKAFSDERPIPLSARMLFLWFYHACRRGWPRFLMVSDHMNYLTFEDPAAINLVRRALKLAQAGDLYGAAETASVEVGHAAVVSEGLRRGMRYSIGAEVDNDPRSRPDAQNIVDAMKPDGMIRSVHFLTIDHPTHGPNWSWPFDNPEFIDVFEIVGTAKTWQLYMAALLDAVERLPGNIVGHFYVPALYGHWPDDATLEKYENQIVDACEARGMAMELNTRFLYRDRSDEEQVKYLAAHRRLLAKCKAKNVGIAVGSDAHSPKDQGRAFETVLALLDECEINELIFPIAGRLARVALRVERTVVAVPEPAPVPSVEERKVARKARASEAPGRPGTGTAAPESDDAVPPKAKPRSKRKGRTVEAAEARTADGASYASAAVPIGGAASKQNLRTATDAEPAAVELTAQSARSHAVADTTETMTDVEFGPVVAHAKGLVPANASEPGLSVEPQPVLAAKAEPARAYEAEPIPAHDAEPVGTDQTEPVGTDEAEPVCTDQAKPVGTDEAEPVGTDETEPVGTDQAESVGTDQAQPVGSDQAEPVGTDEAEPVGSDQAEPVGTDEAEPNVAGAAKGPVVVDDATDPLLENESVTVAIVDVPARDDAVIEPQGALGGRDARAGVSRKPRAKGPAAKSPGTGKPKGSGTKSNAGLKKAAKPAGKPTAKTSAKKAPAKKVTAKKAAPKKAPAKKIPAKKAAIRAAAAKKTAAKKSGAKKNSPKKPAQRRR